MPLFSKNKSKLKIEPLFLCANLLQEGLQRGMKSVLFYLCVLFSPHFKGGQKWKKRELKLLSPP